MNPSNNAIIELHQDGKIQRRPAAFVFPMTDGGGNLQGFGWIEPRYIDPAGVTMRADHYRIGQVDAIAEGRGFTVSNPHEGISATVLPWGEATDDEDRTCGAALADFGDYLAEKGVTIDQEWAEVRAALGIPADGNASTEDDAL
jgi:hypothetical protein